MSSTLLNLGLLISEMELIIRHCWVQRPLSLAQCYTYDLSDFSILWDRKLRHREVTWAVQGRTARRGRAQTGSQLSLSLEPVSRGCV